MRGCLKTALPWLAVAIGLAVTPGALGQETKPSMWEPFWLGKDRPRPRPGRNPNADLDVVDAADKLRRAQRRKDLPGPGATGPDFRLKLVEGSSAPDFALADAEGRVRLSAHRGRKPVVLIFGSHT